MVPLRASRLRPSPLPALPCGSMSTSRTFALGRGEARGEVDGGGGLSDAALLVRDADDPSHGHLRSFSPDWMRGVACWDDRATSRPFGRLLPTFHVERAPVRGVRFAVSASRNGHLVMDRRLLTARRRCRTPRRGRRVMGGPWGADVHGLASGRRPSRASAARRPPPQVSTPVMAPFLDSRRPPRCPRNRPGRACATGASREGPVEACRTPSYGLVGSSGGPSSPVRPRSTWNPEPPSAWRAGKVSAAQQGLWYFDRRRGTEERSSGDGATGPSRASSKTSARPLAATCSVALRARPAHAVGDLGKTSCQRLPRMVSGSSNR